MPRGDNAGRPRKYGVKEGISLDVTEADILSLEAAVEAHEKKKGVNSRGMLKAQRDENNAVASERVTTSVPARVDTSEIISAFDEPLPKANPSDSEGLSRSAAQTLTPSQLQAIDLLSNLAERHTIEQVAQVVQVHPGTIYKWLNQVPFLTAFEVALREKFLPYGKAKAMMVFSDAMNSKSPSTRMLEIISKSLGFYSDGTDISMNVEVNNVEQNLGITPDYDL